MTNINSRFQVIKGNALIAPGSCYICTTTDKALDFVDVGVTLRRHGRIYFCKLCMTDCGNQIGLISNIAVNTLKNDVADLSEAVHALSKENDDLRNLLSSSLVNTKSDILSSESDTQADSTAAKKPVGRPRKAS